MEIDMGKLKEPDQAARQLRAARVLAKSALFLLFSIVGQQGALALANTAIDTDRVVVVVAAELGQTATVSRSLLALGGDVQVRFDDVGYLRVSMPGDLVAEARALPNVLALEPVRTYPCERSIRTTSHEPRAPILTVERLAHAGILTTGEMNLAGLQSLHPTFDGRGVTVAVLEGCSNEVVDFANPSLQRALTLDGATRPKIAGVIDPISFTPVTRSAYYRIVPQLLRTAHDGDLVIQGRRFSAPRRGRFYAGFYRDADGHEFGVLWDQARRNIWVDADRDSDFRNEPALFDINEKFSFGFINRSDPLGDHRVSFSVAFDQSGDSLLVYEGTNFHHTMVAGMVAAHDLMGAEAQAAAPAARVMVVTTGDEISNAGTIEAYIYAARDRRVDAISDSWGGPSSVKAIIWDRIVSVLNKPIIHAAGNNGPLLRSSTWDGDGGTSRFSLMVGAYQSGATRNAWFGDSVSPADSLWTSTGRGPSENDFTKPDIVAPLNNVTAAPCSGVPWSVPAAYNLPSCFQLSSGTSAAAPAAAGVVAALLSGVRQTPEMAFSAPQLAQAIRSSARFLESYAPHEQGFGLIDATGAWDALRAAGDEPPPQMSMTTRQGGLHDSSGHGIFKKRAWIPGATETFEIDLTRSTGPLANVTYGLRWRGNDGTFELSAETATLARNAPLSVQIRATPPTVGVHSALLELVDLRHDIVLESFPLTIVAAAPLDATNDFSLDQDVQLRWADGASIFFDVPAGAQSLSIVVRSTDVPYRVRVGNISRHTIEGLQSTRVSDLFQPNLTHSIMVREPVEGVQELRILMCSHGVPDYTCEAFRGREGAGTVHVEVQAHLGAVQ